MTILLFKRLLSSFASIRPGLRRFPSLKHLIGYYTKYVDLLKQERLVYPVPAIEASLILLKFRLFDAFV